MEDKKGKKLGEKIRDGKLYEYYLREGYVFVHREGIDTGWICSFPTWENTVNKILLD